MTTLRELSVQTLNGITSTKGDIIVNDGLTNNKIAIGADTYILTADSTQSIGVSWRISPTANNSLINLVNIPYSTNSGSPVTIDELTQTPTPGQYLIKYHFTYTVGKTQGPQLMIGLYMDNVLSSNTQNSLNGIVSGQVLHYSNFDVLTFDGTQVLTFQYYSSDGNTSVSIESGNISLIMISNT